MFLTVIVTPGITAPVSSVTVPEMLPVVACAKRRWRQEQERQPQKDNLTRMQRPPSNGPLIAGDRSDRRTLV